MNIEECVIEKYLLLCPFSTARSENYNEIKNKILRAVRIGKTIQRRKDSKVIGYHNLNFIIKNNTVTCMWKDINKLKYTYVSEELKMTYDKYEFKVLV